MDTISQREGTPSILRSHVTLCALQGACHIHLVASSSREWLRVGEEVAIGGALDSVPVQLLTHCVASMSNISWCPNLCPFTPAGPPDPITVRTG
jgi:hypothetical protein